MAFPPRHHGFQGAGTDFGGFMGDFPTIQSIATLAWIAAALKNSARS